MKREKGIKIPDVTEFTDDEGQHWVQTSTEDLFSAKELNELLEEVEKEKEEGDIILAHIDFKRVNKEYYDTVKELQSKLKKRNELLKKLIIETRDAIDRKNKKLKEMIQYIKKLHILLAYYKLRPEDFDKLEFTPQVYAPPRKMEMIREIVEEVEEEPVIISYSEVNEQVLNDEGKETDSPD